MTHQRVQDRVKLARAGGAILNGEQHTVKRVERANRLKDGGICAIHHKARSGRFPKQEQAEERRNHGGNQQSH